MFEVNPWVPPFEWMTPIRVERIWEVPESGVVMVPGQLICRVSIMRMPYPFACCNTVLMAGDKTVMPEWFEYAHQACELMLRQEDLRPVPDYVGGYIEALRALLMPGGAEGPLELSEDELAFVMEGCRDARHSIG